MVSSCLLFIPAGIFQTSETRHVHEQKEYQSKDPRDFQELPTHCESMERCHTKEKADVNLASIKCCSKSTAGSVSILGLFYQYCTRYENTNYLKWLETVHVSQLTLKTGTVFGPTFRRASD